MKAEPDLIDADTPQLLGEIAALAHVIWHQHYTPIIGREQVEYMLAEGYSEAALGEQCAAGTRFLLARRGEAYAAFAACTHDSNNPATAWLDKLYVHLNARGCGIARALVERAADLARSFGASRLKLRVNRHNPESIAAYKRLGFEIEQEDVKSIGNGFVMDDYIMTAPLARLLPDAGPAAISR